ncbi:MAG: hypothetical protein ACR5KW_03260 [Wolbachia sp.]
MNLRFLKIVEFINLCDPNEVYSLPDQIDESIAEIAWFNQREIIGNE